MADTQGINKVLCVTWMQNGPGHPALKLYRALVNSVSHQADGTGHDHIFPKGASTLDSLQVPVNLLRKPKHKWMPEMSECLKFKHWIFQVLLALDLVNFSIKYLCCFNL